MFKNLLNYLIFIYYIQIFINYVCVNSVQKLWQTSAQLVDIYTIKKFPTQVCVKTRCLYRYPSTVYTTIYKLSNLGNFIFNFNSFTPNPQDQ